MTARRAALAAWLPFAVWCVLIIGLSSVPNLKPPDVGLPIADKFAHLGEYGILGAWFGRARRRPDESAARAALVGALLGLGFGTLDEIYQRGTPGRESSWLDTLADTVGAMLGAWTYHRVTSWRRRRSARGV
jgi:VanZ family protein